MLTIFADGADKGIIPLTCSELFVRVEDKTALDPNVSFTVEVSYIEVPIFYSQHWIVSDEYFSDL